MKGGTQEETSTIQEKSVVSSTGNIPLLRAGTPVCFFMVLEMKGRAEGGNLQPRLEGEVKYHLSRPRHHSPRCDIEFLPLASKGSFREGRVNSDGGRI